MISLINPVAVKELRERLRGRRAVFILSAYLFVLFFITLFVLGVAVPQTEDLINTWEMGRALFWSLVSFELLVACLISPAFAAASITSEREKQTLDMLEATLLTPRQILTGKLISSCAFVLYLVMAALPLAAIVFGLGGISLADFFIAFAVIVGASYFYAAFGLYCSTVFKRTIASVGVTIITLVLATIITGPIIPLIEGFGALENVPFSFMNPFVEMYFVAIKTQAVYALQGGFELPLWIPGLVLFVLGGTHFLSAGTAQFAGARQDRSFVYRINFFLIVSLVIALPLLAQKLTTANASDALAFWVFLVLSFLLWSVPFFFATRLTAKEWVAPAWKLPLLAVRPLSILRNRGTSAMTYFFILLGAQLVWLIPIAIAKQDALDKDLFVLLARSLAVIGSAIVGWGVLSLGVSHLIPIKFASRGLLIFAMLFVTLGCLIPWFPHSAIDVMSSSTVMSETFRAVNPYYPLFVDFAGAFDSNLMVERALDPLIPCLVWNLLLAVVGLGLWESGRRVRKDYPEQD